VSDRSPRSSGSPATPSYPEPTFHAALPYEKSNGALACSLAALAGIDLIDYQRDELMDWGARGDGGYLHREIGSSIPRQAGKSTAGIAWAVFRAVAEGAKVLWSDHNYSTTCEMLSRFRDIFGRKPNDPYAKHPQFNKLLVDASSKTAQEKFVLSTGGVICFATRTKSASLGYSFDMVVYDEAQELTDEQQQAIIPTTSSGALHDTQALYLGTPTRPGSPGTVFGRLRGKIRRGEEPGACWWEWGVSEVGDVYDDSRVYAVNPALPHVADIEAIRAARGQMTELAFAQEYLGYWLPSEVAVVPAVPVDAWAACATAEPARGEPAAWGVKFSPDGAEVAVAVAVPCERGWHVELAARRSTVRGSGWLARAIASRQGATWVLDGKGSARALMERLPEDADCAYEAKTSDVVEASAVFLDAVREGALEWFDAGAGETDQLTASVERSPKRKIGTGGGWGFGGADSAPVEAAALAVWAAGKFEEGEDMEVYF
jgi:hypothetical protein